ncbi:MAG TPA: hypothetical protein VNX47_10790 [Nevskia sp.]|nr:hypothetical protein [Nevskia sp.]
MAKPNYQFDKRQRELAKQKKQNEKQLKKQAAKAGPAADDAETADKASSDQQA